MEKLPDRLTHIVTSAIHAIDWNDLNCDPSIGFHYRYHKNEYGSWTIIIHPAIHEIIGGIKDGSFIYPRYNISILDITKLFDEVFDMGMSSRENKFWIDGMANNILFSLEIMEKPPSRAKITKKYNWYTKEISRK